jgi:hypothetical protein
VDLIDVLSHRRRRLLAVVPVDHEKTWRVKKLRLVEIVPIL